jgi:hypothetical protein
VEIVKMDDQELYVPDEASATSYQMLPKKSKLGYQKELEKCTRNENQWVKDSERNTMSESGVNERETVTHW